MIDERRITIGRAPDNTVVLRAAQVSRCHCVIETADGVSRIRDLDSRYGITVNGRPVTEATIGPGDRVTVGGYELAVVDPAEAKPEPAAGDGSALCRTLEQELAGARAEVDRQQQRCVDQGRLLEAVRKDLEDRRSESTAQQESLESEVARLRGEMASLALEVEQAEDPEPLKQQIDLLLASQLESAQRAAAAQQVLEQCAADLRRLQEAWRRMSAIHQTLKDAEELWIETDQRAREAVSSGPAAVEQMLVQRQAVTDQLATFHSAHESAMGELRSIVHRLGRLPMRSSTDGLPVDGDAPQAPRAGWLRRKLQTVRPHPAIQPPED